MPSKPRTARSRANGTAQHSPQAAHAPKRRTAAATRPQRAPAPRAAPASDVSESADEAVSDEYREEDEDSDGDDVNSLHSDALDEDSEDDLKKRVGGKRKRASPAKPRAAARPRKKAKKADSDVDVDDDDDDDGLKDGQEIVGKVVQAPKTGRVPPGQISQNTFDFLSQLKKPACNDREWFRLHEPVFRLAETEFKHFVEKFTDLITEVDPQIPPLPPKDVVYRIYRDVRFSNDKTPYKTNFSATFSRSGRKGIFAGYHIMITPGGGSLLAAGTWCPGKNELATIRSHIQRGPARLRRIINAPAFVDAFGFATPRAQKGRQSIFGRDDELKTAPKGVDKNHKDIDLLKCRSFVVLHHFTDEEVLSPEFGRTVAEVVRAAKPLVYCMNDWMTVGNEDEDEEDGNGEEGPADTDGEPGDGDEEDEEQ